MVINRLNCLAPVLSRAVDVTMSNGISGPFYGYNGSGDIRNAQSWHAHGTAQNRRGLVRRAITSSARRVLRPTGSGALVIASRLRLFAYSPFRRSAVSPRSVSLYSLENML